MVEGVIVTLEESKEVFSPSESCVEVESSGHASKGHLQLRFDGWEIVV